MTLTWTTPADAATLAAIHAQAFDKPWPASDFDELLTQTGVFGALAGDPAQGMILCRIAGGEMEVLTIGVAGPARRQGLAQALMAAALGAARQAGAQSVLLEVGTDNPPAVALYERLGFARAGLRRGYYDRGAGRRADALVMRLDLVAQDA